LQAANFSAEYGNAAGGVVNILSKSGTNQLHGSAFAYFRNRSLNAKNYFETSQDPLRRNQYGVTLGGTILRDKLFFFGTYQGTRISTTTASGVTFVPTAHRRL
jgi:outer membrane cobalamin receptor